MLATSRDSTLIVGLSNFINQKFGVGVESCMVCKVSQERDILINYIYCKAWLDEISAIKRSLRLTRRVAFWQITCNGNLTGYIFLMFF